MLLLEPPADSSITTRFVLISLFVGRDSNLDCAYARAYDIHAAWGFLCTACARLLFDLSNGKPLSLFSRR